MPTVSSGNVKLAPRPLSSAGLSSVAAVSESREHQRGGDWEGPPNSGLGQHR